MEGSTCRTCGGEIAWRRTLGGWLHAAPLGQLRVLHWEAQDVHADPPPKGLPLNRKTHMHPAEPGPRR